MEKYNPHEECVKCGNGNHCSLAYGYTVKYLGGFRGHDGLKGEDVYGPEELSVECNVCHYVVRRACLDAEV